MPEKIRFNTFWGTTPFLGSSFETSSFASRSSAKREGFIVAKCTVERLMKELGLRGVEIATLQWVWWFNHHRLLESIGYIPPLDYEQAYYSRHEIQSLEAVLI